MMAPLTVDASVVSEGALPNSEGHSLLLVLFLTVEAYRHECMLVRMTVGALALESTGARKMSPCSILY